VVKIKGIHHDPPESPSIVDDPKKNVEAVEHHPPPKPPSIVDDPKKNVEAAEHNSPPESPSINDDPNRMFQKRMLFPKNYQIIWIQQKMEIHDNMLPV